MDPQRTALIQKFLSIQVENHDSRTKIGLTEEDMALLHNSSVRGEVPWTLYHEVNNALKADFIYQKSGKQQGWTIAFIREQLNYTRTSEYTYQGEQVHETISGRIWPKGYLINRVRSKSDPLSIKHELEWVLSPAANIETFWTRAKPQLEMAGIDLLQNYPDDPFIQDLAFLPNNTNFTATIIVTSGECRKTLEFPIAVRYEPLIKKLGRTYQLDDTSSDCKAGQSRPLRRATTEELQELSHALWSAVRTYDEKKDIPIPTYLQNQLLWHMGKVFKDRSVEIERVGTSRPRRKLKAGFERSGGSLDDPLPGQEEDSTESVTRRDTTPDPHAEPPDTKILIQQIFDASVDETDREILRLYLRDYTQSEIATALNISQPAISQRLKRLRRRVEG